MKAQTIHVFLTFSDVLVDYVAARCSERDWVLEVRLKLTVLSSSTKDLVLWESTSA